MPKQRGLLPADSDEEGSDGEELRSRQYKVILIGNGAVGKTSLAHRFCDGGFSASYKQTIGLDFFVKRLVLPGDVNVCLQVWDIGGQSIGGKMISRYIYGSDAVIMVYDITSYQSFQDLNDWLHLVYGCPELLFSIDRLLFLMANKDDLEHMRMVSRAKHSVFALERGMSGHFLVSAKTGDEVATAFYQIAANLAGITLKEPEIQVHQKVVKAELVDYPQDDPLHAHVVAPRMAARTSSRRSRCTVQ
ncbi:Rab6, putative [Perkinsus marinus ATCC 50983]|uniref:Rab6, putative n=1 Tax=Perkinsus marinus (strain ATCC 50983 / TXsc) TaxID=423536 RepID=C5LRJ2_PERM5|nr:Rab6, putative [Perkinsus marinus ATCC 50983]EER00655.1 Rab6, putative [Perkinsus marinus ATCC 50983]|eukprot:XP_002767937.1 Rab6, putative [Perkinsus marinus ATCC 50983]